MVQFFQEGFHGMVSHGPMAGKGVYAQADREPPEILSIGRGTGDFDLSLIKVLRKKIHHIGLISPTLQSVAVLGCQFPRLDLKKCMFLLSILCF